jgi:hypothetical protein
MEKILMMCEATILAMIDTMKDMAEDARKFEDKRLMNESAGTRVRVKIEPLRQQLKELRKMMLAIRKNRVESGVRTR